MRITASQLYDHIACPRRVDLDAHGDPAGRAELSAFVRMLWERGADHERSVVATLPPGTVLLAALAGDERERRTAEAMADGAPLIHGGRIAAGDLLGEPDLLIRRGNGYLPADIKSGAAGEGDVDDDGSVGRPKAHHAVQIALYVDVLERLGMSAGRLPEIWDVRGDHVPFDLTAPRGPRTPATWWDLYEASRDSVRDILRSPGSTRAAHSSVCGLCHWRERCSAELEAADDLTRIPQLGRALRDTLQPTVGSVASFAASNPETFVVGAKTVFSGVGAERLRTFHARARLLADPAAVPYLRRPVVLPSADVELFFDIEADPMRDLVYLHGFTERGAGEPGTGRFTGFFADDCTPEGERRAFEGAVGFLAARPDAAVFYYSNYERTMYRKLQRRHPEVCTAGDIEALFTPPRSVDLYCDVVQKATEWPTLNHSIKTLAKYLGFRWRDADPSGAASIEWYHRWIETADPSVRQRILDYNEDDCRATAVLLDGIRLLPTTGNQAPVRTIGASA
jgi:predicted RecB family nuclease